MNIIHKHFKSISILIATLIVSLTVVTVGAEPVEASTINNVEDKAIVVTEKKKPKTREVRKVTVSRNELTCLAQNIYYEAGYESEEGKIAVANVTMNRVNSGTFPKSVCGVVYYKHGNYCAFSWACDNKPDTPPNNKSYIDAIRIAKLALTGALEDVTNGADHFHEVRVRPKWSRTMVKTTQIGRHIFYNSSYRI